MELQEGIKIVSLFNGISCGRQAFKELGIEVEEYCSFEIDKHSNAIAKYNFPDDTYLGDVTKADFREYEGFDWVVGGSPCTYWSIAKKDRETTSDGIGFELFSHFARAVQEVKPKYFLYENNKSIHKDIKTEITKYLGVEHIMINAALVSGQNRERCYWVGIRQADGTYKTADIEQPQDLGILLKDVLVSGEDLTGKDKSFAYTTRCQGAIPSDTVKRNRHTMVVEPVLRVREATKKGYVDIQCGDCVDLTQPNSKTRRGRSMKDKCNCLTQGNQYYQFIGVDPVSVAQRGRYVESGNRSSKVDGPTFQAIELRVDSKANCVTTVSKDSMVESPVQIDKYGGGGQGQRIYSVKGKSVCISSNSGGKGGSTGLYKLDLPDGDYIIRKLYPVEAEALQTLPCQFTAMGDYGEGDKRHHGIMPVAATNRYKAIGNGWCVAVIKHIIRSVMENE